MLMETGWLKMLVDRAENKGYVIWTDQVWFGHRGIAIFIDWNVFNGATAPSVSGSAPCRVFTITLRHTTLTS